MVRIRVILQDTSNLNILNLPKVISSKFIDLNKIHSSNIQSFVSSVLWNHTLACKTFNRIVLSKESSDYEHLIKLFQSLDNSSFISPILSTKYEPVVS